MEDVTVALDDGTGVRRGTSPYTPVKVTEKVSPLSRAVDGPTSLVTSTFPVPIWESASTGNERIFYCQSTNLYMRHRGMGAIMKMLAVTAAV